MKKNANQVFDENNIIRYIDILLRNKTGFIKSSKIEKQEIRNNGPKDHNVWFKYNGDEVELGIVNGNLWQFRTFNSRLKASYLYNINHFLQYCVDNQRKTRKLTK